MRRVVAVLALAVLAAPLAADAQQPGKVRRIGWLGLAASTPPVERVLDGLRNGLRELGWVEGQNLIIEYRWAEGKPERLAGLAGDLTRLNVELIVANCGPQIDAIRKASGTIPVVVSACPDLVGAKLVASLAHPGGNITGLGMLGLELSAKRLQLLKETFPKVARVAVLGHPVYDWTPQWKEMEPAGRTLGVTVLPLLEVRTPDDFEGAFASIMRQRADALVVPADPFTFLHRKRIVDLAKRNQLPTMFDLKEYVEEGGLISYGPSVVDTFRRAAVFVDKILKGATPADLPVEQPTKFELVINLKTAKALGLTIPPSVLVRADEVIQ